MKKIHKNKKAKEILYFIISIFVMIFVFILLCNLIFLAFSAFGKLSDTLKAGIFSGLAIIAVAFITFFANKSINYKQSIEKSMRPKKIELYDECITFFSKLMMNDTAVAKPDEKKMVSFFVDIMPLCVLYSSNQVIKSLSKIKKMNGNPEDLIIMEDLMVEIRKDLGHTKRGFKKGDILRLFINDIDKYIDKNGKVIKNNQSQQDSST